MEELIKNLITAIEKIGIRDAWDYASIIVPALTAIISVVISVIALRKSNKIGERQNELSEKQNNIALFEPRFKVFNILNFLLPVARTILANTNKKDEEQKDNWDILASAMQTYKYSTTPFEKEIEFSQVEYFYTNLVLETGGLTCLFKNENTKPILSFLETLDSIATNVCNDEDCDQEINLLRDIVCEIDESNIMDRLEQYLML